MDLSVSEEEEVVEEEDDEQSNTNEQTPDTSPAPAKEENPLKRRLQNTLATLQRELESDAQETPTTPATTSSSSPVGSPLRSSGMVNAVAAAFEKKSSESKAGSPPPQRRKDSERKAPPAIASVAKSPLADVKPISKLTLRTSSGSGSKDREYINLGEGKGSYNSVLQRQVDRLRDQVESLQRHAHAYMTTIKHSY